MRDMNAPSGLYRGYPAMAAMDWWGQEKWDPIPQLRGEPKPEPLPEIKVTDASSPWTLPLPGPACPGFPGFSPSQFGSLEDIWESHSHHSHHSHTSEHSDWTSEPKYIQLGEPQETAISHRSVVRNALWNGKSVNANANQLEPGLKLSPAPGLSNDPGLSGQRLKRVMHVKQAPIYKYAEWCSYWAEKGGRASDDPTTPRSELTKSEFDVQYGAWRKALVEGPPQRSAPKVLVLNEHVR